MYHPTNPGNSSQNQTRLAPNYEPTISDNPYSYSPYDLQNVPPPPKPPHVKNKTVFTLVVTIVVLLVVMSGLVLSLIHVSNGKSPMNLNTPTKAVSQPTPTITATPIPSPTIATIPPTSVTADQLFYAFVVSGISATNSIEVDHSFWLQCCTYYPAHGSVQFTEKVNGNTLIIAVFNNAQDASLIASQQQWAAQYIQVDMCLLLSLEGPVIISYYKPVMLQYCV